MRCGNLVDFLVFVSVLYLFLPVMAFDFGLELFWLSLVENGLV